MIINPSFSYIQLLRSGKTPTRDWKGDPRVAPSEVREWIAQGYNAGVRTDRQSGVWVLDVDVDVHTFEPTEEWKQLLAENELPATYTVKTPSGGLHYYFRFPEVDVRNDQGQVIAKGVDIRGIGGYVVAAGSRASYDKHGVHFEGEYVVVDDSPISPTPDWIASRFRAREEAKAAKAERVNTGTVMPKADSIEPEWDRFAKDELNALFAQVSALSALPDGESMEILGEQRGWERGAGFFTLACKIIEVARWPHTSITVEQAHQAWIARVPTPKYAQHDWNNALETAAPTWAWGEQQRSPMDLFEGVPTRGNSSAPGDGGAEPEGPWEPLDVSDKPTGWGIPIVYQTKKDDEPDAPSGGLMVDRARQLINRIGPIAVDPSGSLWTYDTGVYVNDDDVVLDRLYHMLGDRFTATQLTNVKLAVRAKSPLIDLTRPPNPGVMNFLNGTLEWRSSDVVQPHDPGVLETTQFPYAWNPAATCPKFEGWLATMLDEDQINLAWKIIGYMMLSGNPLQVAIMLYGKGSNGKGTFLRALDRVLGMSNVSSVPLKDFNARFQTTAMIGKIANIVGDIDSDYQMATAAFKQVTGADPMMFERKGRDAFRAVLWSTCVFSANKIPGTNDGSEGYAERWVPLHFKKKASEHRIEGFSEEALWEEIPGIAAKAVRVLRTLPLHQGSIRNQAFDLSSESAQEAVEEFREASNSYYAWIKNHTVPSETEVMKPKELWSAYRLATGVRNGGANCPPSFREVLDEKYGEARMRRGMYLGVQRNIRGYAATVVDDDAEGAKDSDFFDSAMSKG